MKKTLLSVTSLLLVSGFVGSAALAAFLPTGTFAGMEFRTSNLALLVDPDFIMQDDFRTDHFLPGAFAMYPGMEMIPDDFAVKNDSDQGQNLKVSAKILPGNKDWDTLKNIITLKVFSHTNGQSTPEYTLAEWSESPREFPYPVLEAHASQGYQMQYAMLPTYPEDPDGSGPLEAGSPIGPEMMDKVTQNAAFVLTGEPVHPY